MTTARVAKGKGETARPAVASRALAKGLELIDLATAAKAPMSLGELAAATRLGKPSTLRLLQTLNVLGYLRKDDAGSYLPGMRVPGVSANDWVQRLVAAASVEMERLNGDLAETVSLAALMDDHVRVVHTIESPQHIRMSNYNNRILPPYASSLGKVIGAYQTPECVQTLIQVYGIYQITDKTITERVLIREELARIRERGYSIEFEETVVGGCCFGAAIQERDGHVRSGLSVSLPVARLTERLEKLIPERVMQAAEVIARNLAK